ncbi:MAG TPA: hypothetical protein DDY78_02510 [Planctomycetales bacterium]|jgi:hypothetical protein|nr:hypothetical protein [Planctomycetales bacterium]
MPKRRPDWFVAQDPASICYAYFISHVGEDGDEVKELKQEIEALSGRGGRTPLDCFLDRHNWPGGNENTAVIQQYLLKSQYMLTWVTPAYLQTVRGWVWVELAYADLIEASINLHSFGRRPFPYIVPVFRGTVFEQVERTLLVDYWSSKLVRPDEDVSIKEIARRLVDFHEQEAEKHL